MPKKKSAEFDRFKALTEAIAAVPKKEIEKRAAADARKKQRAKKTRRKS